MWLCYWKVVERTLTHWTTIIFWALTFQIKKAPKRRLKSLANLWRTPQPVLLWNTILPDHTDFWCVCRAYQGQGCGPSWPPRPCRCSQRWSGRSSTCALPRPRKLGQNVPEKRIWTLYKGLREALYLQHSFHPLHSWNMFQHFQPTSQPGGAVILQNKRLHPYITVSN